MFANWSSGADGQDLKLRERTCPPLMHKAQRFLKHGPSCAGQCPLPASRQHRRPEFALVTGQAQHVFVSQLRSLCIQASPSFSWWVVALFLDVGGPARVLAPSPPRCAVLHTPPATLLRLPRRVARVRHEGACPWRTRRRDRPVRAAAPAALCAFAYAFSLRSAAVLS